MSIYFNNSIFITQLFIFTNLVDPSYKKPLIPKETVPYKRNSLYPNNTCTYIKMRVDDSLL